jgi:hypothetical protein
LQAEGFDGMTHIGGDRMGGGKHHRVWIAFEPTQIKSVNNRGTFDPSSDRIDYVSARRPAEYASWEENKHPRGQPENAGQFSSVPGLMKAMRKEGGEGAEKPPEVGTSGKSLFKDMMSRMGKAPAAKEPTKPPVQGHSVKDLMQRMHKPPAPPQGQEDPSRFGNWREFAPAPEGEKETPSPTGRVANSDPAAVDPKTGIASTPRVGVPGPNVPPPPADIPRLPNLTEAERKAETNFARLYLHHPDDVAREYRDQLKAGKIGDAPNIFNTDDAKLLSQDYNPRGQADDAVKDARSTYNVAVHQTANVIAKRAFLQHLDEVVAKLPEDKRSVLVTSGGVASGKGFSLANVQATSEIANKVGAVWDAAGEQNAAENPWVLDECKKRGMRAIFAYIHADPAQTWENPERGVVERAGKKGRMVDARVFADSYAIGAKNFAAFHQQHQSDPAAQFFFIDNATGGKPKLSEGMPEAAMAVDGEKLYAQATNVIEQRKDKIKPAVYRGGTIGQRIWGKPLAATA